jgi:hypothetical protein
MLWATYLHFHFHSDIAVGCGWWGGVAGVVEVPGSQQGTRMGNKTDRSGGRTNRVTWMRRGGGGAAAGGTPVSTRVWTAHPARRPAGCRLGECLGVPPSRLPLKKLSCVVAAAAAVPSPCECRCRAPSTSWLLDGVLYCYFLNIKAIKSIRSSFRTVVRRCFV